MHCLACFLQHLRDFPLLTEAIQFFAHPESMVRVAVRTITLNIFQGGWVGATVSGRGMHVSCSTHCPPPPPSG